MISLCNFYVHESFMTSPNYNSMLLRIQSESYVVIPRFGSHGQPLK